LKETECSALHNPLRQLEKCVYSFADSARTLPDSSCDRDAAAEAGAQKEPPQKPAGTRAHRVLRMIRATYQAPPGTSVCNSTNPPSLLFRVGRSSREAPTAQSTLGVLDNLIMLNASNPTSPEPRVLLALAHSAPCLSSPSLTPTSSQGSLTRSPRPHASFCCGRKTCVNLDSSLA